MSFAAVCCLLMALTASAHHSHGSYDTSKWTTFQGTVKEVILINPHSWIHLEVKDERGQPALWALEATGPAGLRNNGINRDDVRSGDTIKVRCHALRDGSNGCLLGFVTPMHGDARRGHGIEKEWD
jgi:hypothetical protein